VNGRVLLSTVGFLLAGAALGYAALAAGPLPAITSIIFLVLLLTRFRSQPEQPAGYMVGAGLAGAAILINVIAGCSPPSCYYDLRTPVAVLGFLLVAIVGAGLLVRAVRQRRFSNGAPR
jgi:chromate transport protein ChrA